ncbi:restriction endonuclease subunit S [Bacillus sp. CLL-7-23]|uniref:Restriction endonuclease subunit S n=1 Tax=Bacillus changyiensis TaxID=3004103 RepID=A0ABT4X4B8_9BACI|nr:MULTISPECIES: restriction endonuclease subunit S [Bacillus]MBL4969639.1 restriction endonuclease subunit S [Bacillus halotolerans]MBL4973701.1 restriction endonuclease subunit S [Bacillus halotolerans]MDA7027118.1 restriction endonuclease subunit S [Bacillus changyiensis]
MSKEKKTIEELVEETIVPVEEQPYELPENWRWVKLLNGYAVCLDKYRKPVNAEERAKRVGNIPYYGATGQVGWIDDYLTDEELVLLGEDGVPFLEPFKNKAYIIREKAWVNNHAHILRSNFGSEGNLFLLHYLNQFNFNGYVSGTTRLKLTQKKMAIIPVPLPPLNEQKRIAEKVERLLSKIDEAKQLIKEAKETFELRRAAILDKAFRGELTRKWREENSLEKKEVELINGNQSIESNSPYSIPTTWKWRKLKDVASFKNGFAFKSKDFVEQGIQLVRMGNLYKNDLALDRNPVYMPLDFDEKIIEKYSVKNGDILLSLTGTKYKRDYGYAVRVEGVEKPLLLNQRILSLNPNFMDEYIFYYLQSSVFRDVFFSFETGGVNQGNVGSKAVESILIPIPPLEEAKEIEKMLNNLLKNEKETLKILNVEDKLETLKQATLSKAFRGELGTNDPREENAIELLKEVLQEQVK